MIRRNIQSRKETHGFTLIEMIIFIAIIAVVSAAMLHAFLHTMRGSHYGKELTQATQVAQQRLEVILGQRKFLGYAGFTANTFDPCDSVPAAGWTGQLCQHGSYPVTTSASFVSNICGAGTGTNCRLITVSVTGPQNDVLTRLTYEVWDY